jgi:hypothetical protein
MAAPHWLRQLRDIRRDPASLVAGEQVCRRSPSRLLLEVGERVAAGAADDEALPL